MWFTEAQGNRIGCIDKQGHIQEFEVPTAHSSPTGIRNGPDGNIWFTEEAGSRIGRLNLVNQDDRRGNWFVVPCHNR